MRPLLNMLDCWNDHDIEGHLEVYWKSPKLDGIHPTRSAPSQAAQDGFCTSYQSESRPDLKPKLLKAIVDRDATMHNLEEIIPCER
jgi:hypothetical protein